ERLFPVAYEPKSRKRVMIEIPAQDGFVIGVDVGGTKVAAGLVDHSGEIFSQTRTPMMPNGNAAAGLAAVTSAIDSMSARSVNDPKTQGFIRGIGICSPGPLDPKTGVVINPPMSHAGAISRWRPKSRISTACPSRSTTMPMQPRWPRLSGARAAVMAMFFMRRSVQVLAPVLCSKAASITAVLAPQ